MNYILKKAQLEIWLKKKFESCFDYLNEGGLWVNDDFEVISKDKIEDDNTDGDDD